MKRTILLMSFLFVFSLAGSGQTKLSSGDVLFTTFQSSGTDLFGFTLRKATLKGTQIHFTDDGITSTGKHQGGEGVYVWTAASDLQCGDTQLIYNQLQLNQGGDQIIAYQVMGLDTQYLAAIHFNASSWESNATNSNTSAIPPGLVNEVNAVALGANNNGKISVNLMGVKDSLQYWVNNPSSWTLDADSLSVPLYQQDIICYCDSTLSQHSQLVSSEVGATQMRIHWQRGTGENSLVLMDTINNLTAPEQGVHPFVQTSFTDNGTQAVYFGPDTNALIEGLDAARSYFFKVFSAACADTNIRYNRLDVTNNPNTFTSDVDPISNLWVSCQTDQSFTLTWDNPSTTFDGILVGVRNSNNNVHTAIGNRPDTLIADAEFGSGSAFGGTSPNSYVVYNGVGETIEVTGLTSGEQYQIKVFTYKNGQKGSDEKVAEIIELKQTEIEQFTGLPQSNAMKLEWSAVNDACIDSVLIVASENSILAEPAGMGTSYIADVEWTSGTEIATDEFVVFKGDGSSVIVENLTLNQSYYFKIFTKRGSNWSEGVEIQKEVLDLSYMDAGGASILAVNDAASGGDEISLVFYDTLVPGSSFELTDNGYERLNYEKWGSTEGVVRFTLDPSADALPAGEVLSIVGSGYEDSDFDIFIDGVNVNSSWDVSSLNGSNNFALSAENDQLWVLQGGTWQSGNESHTDVYTGEVLCGWSPNGFETQPGFASTNGTTIPFGNSCFALNTSSLTNPGRFKYTGTTTDTVQRNWQLRIQNPNSFTSYSSNVNYNQGGTDFRGDGLTIGVDTGRWNEGFWGNYTDDQDWSNCLNWQNLTLPDSTTVVEIEPSDDDLFLMAGDTAQVGSLQLENNVNFSIEGDSSAVLMVHGDLIIMPGASLIGTDSVANGKDGKVFIEGDLIDLNTDSTGYLPGRSTLIFNGSSKQVLRSSTKQFRVNNLKVENDKGVETVDTIRVSRRLNLNSGPLVMEGDGIVYFEDDAEYKNNNEKWFIDGRVVKQGNDPFVFPLGSIAGGKHFIGMSAPDNEDDIFIAQWVDSAATDISTNYGGNIETVSGCSFWRLDEIQDVGAPNSITVSLYYNTSSDCDNQHFLTETSDLLVAKYNGASWEDLGLGTISGDTQSGIITAASPISSFSPFSLGSSDAINSPLPVELIEFKVAECSSENVAVSWITASELNSSHFELFAYSAKGTDPVFLGEVKGAGNSFEKRYYNLTVANNVRNIFRLKIIDLDGTFEWSPFIYSPCKSLVYGTLSFASENQQLKVFGLKETTSFQLYNLHGQLTAEFDLNTNDNIASLNCSKGVYIVKWRSKGFERYRKITIQ